LTLLSRSLSAERRVHTHVGYAPLEVPLPVVPAVTVAVVVAAPKPSETRSETTDRAEREHGDQNLASHGVLLVS
jgi:hypothetical protein